eukprot:TRINITY_DN24196_c0_g1_i2.p1 TRINITY_DN24196_c0_g1~~TRINITY_DN24196_c0_g1_i2.p1  ORF type:complete len:533 (+),score=129.90 TRINITY_DN24196_c0_g1_i2:50-1600(+)
MATPQLRPLPTLQTGDESVRAAAWDLIGSDGSGGGADSGVVPAAGLLNDALWVGGLCNADDEKWMTDTGITAVADLTGSEQAPGGLRAHLSVRIEDAEDVWHHPDGYEFLRDGGWAVLEQLHQWVRSGRRVLVHCVEGRNRGPAIATAYCVVSGRCTAAEALRRIAAVRGGVLHNRGFALSLAALEKAVTTHIPVKTAASQVDPRQADMLDRLTEACEVSRPELVPFLPELLARCGGKEELLLRCLKQLPSSAPKSAQPEAKADSAGAALLSWARSLAPVQAVAPQDGPSGQPFATLLESEAESIVHIDPDRLSQKAVEKALAAMTQVAKNPMGLVAVDTEWRDGHPQLVQLAFGFRGSTRATSTVLLYYCARREMPAAVVHAVREALASSAVLVFSAPGDVKQLLTLGFLSREPTFTGFAGFLGQGVWLDLQRAAQQRPWSLVGGVNKEDSRVRNPPGLRKVVQEILHLDLDKAQQCSNWSARPLTSQQIHYAALDSVLGRVLRSTARGGLASGL